MTINKKAVTAKAYDILCKYDPKNIKESYWHLYENIEDPSISSGLSSLHQRIDELFVFMNKKSNVSKDSYFGKHYNADESRELLSITRDIDKLKKLFISLGDNLTIDGYYSKCLEYTTTFLIESGGSPIPDSYKDIEIKDVEPIFYLSKENEIVNTQNIKKITREYAKEQIQKCEDKISNGDYSGAITNSRSLVESVIKDIYKKITGEDMKLQGSLSRDWNMLSKKLYLHPKKAPSDDLKEMMVGLISIMNGLSAVRNKMSDSHGNTYKAEKHHAVLVVKTAFTFVEFIYDTYDYQEKHGNLFPSERDNPLTSASPF